MSSHPIKIPMPLSPDEVKRGIAKRMTDSFLDTLNRCGPLNAGVATTLKAKWTITYSLDDFGMVTEGQMAGSTGEPFDGGEVVEGEIEAMPPDKFRADTAQPIPAPQVANPKPKEETMYRAGRKAGARKTS